MATAPMRRVLSRGLAALAVATVVTLGGAACSSSSGGAASTGAGSGAAATTGAATGVVRHLDPAGFASLIAQPGTVLLDVRTPAEYAAGHLTRARNLDLQASDFTTQLSTLDKSANYALYCHTGNRSNTAAQQMLAAGFTHVADLAGGITAWTAAGSPVVTS